MAKGDENLKQLTGLVRELSTLHAIPHRRTTVYMLPEVAIIRYIRASISTADLKKNQNIHASVTSPRSACIPCCMTGDTTGPNDLSDLSPPPPISSPALRMFQTEKCSLAHLSSACIEPRECFGTFIWRDLVSQSHADLHQLQSFPRVRVLETRALN